MLNYFDVGNEFLNQITNLSENHKKANKEYEINVTLQQSQIMNKLLKY